MRHLKKVLFSVILALSFQLVLSQPGPVYVIVHGAWGGGWAFKKVDSLLSADGNIVYRPTLTGQGERVHLASPDIRLQTHILDIVNTILYEDLRDVVLVGHSYGGMVITGVADSVPERIRKLIYLDAFVPEEGESVVSIIEKTGGNPLPNINGFVIPFWVPKDKAPPKDVPQSYKTWSDTIHLKNTKRTEIPTMYIETVAKGTDPKNDDFAFLAQRARDKGWPVLFLESDHNAQWSAPEELVKLLRKSGRE